MDAGLAPGTRRGWTPDTGRGRITRTGALNPNATPRGSHRQSELPALMNTNEYERLDTMNTYYYLLAMSSLRAAGSTP